MFISDVFKKEECRNEALQQLRRLGVKCRPKKPKQLHFKQTGNVFKVPLASLPTETVTLKTGQQIAIPKLVHHLCSIISSQISVEGIFRKEGSKSRQTEMKALLNQGGQLNAKDPVLDVAVLLKVFLRDLPEPLIPWGYHELFFRCALVEPYQDTVEAIMLACLLLPIEHLNTLTYLMQFFEDVSAHSNRNKMNAYNIAVCVGPNILPLDDNLSAATAQSRISKTNDIIKLLIENSPNLGVIPDCIIDSLGSSDADKKKKRRSGSLTRMFNGLKKIVGGKFVEENHNVVTPDLLLTPVSNVSTKKRRTQANGISNKKKKELLNKLPENVLLSTPFTPCRTPVSMDLSGAHEKRLKDSTDLIKDKKWFSRSKSVKNLKNEENTVKNHVNLRNGLERRWSAISQTTNIKRTKKRNSFAAAALSHKESRSKADKKKQESPEPDYIRVPKQEYEAIKNRVSAMERRISMELETVQSLISTENENNTNEEVDSNIKNVQTVYEQTLVQAEHLSPTTDHLAKRLSRELKIRRSADQKIIRSPSARKIGSMRRRSKEFEKSNSKVTRHQTWHVPQTETIPRVNLKRGKPNTVLTGLPANRFETESMETKEMKRTRSSTTSDQVVKNISCNLSGSSCDTWMSAEGFFATMNSNNESSSLSDRASLARLRSQNAGMVLAKARLFDKLKDSDSSSSCSIVRSIPRAKMGSKIGCARNLDSRSSHRVRNLKYEEKRLNKKSMSPRRRNGCLSQKQKLHLARQYLDSSAEKNSDKENIPENIKSLDKNVVLPLKDCNRVEEQKILSPKYSTPKAIPPHIKRPLNVRSPKRLCRTPVGIDRSTPLRVLKTPISNNH